MSTEELRYVVPRSVLLSILEKAKECRHPMIPYTGDEAVDRAAAEAVRKNYLDAIVAQVENVLEPTPWWEPWHYVEDPLRRFCEKPLTGEQPRVP